MAERRSGPVKPPVIDLKAREAASGTATPAADAPAKAPGAAEAAPESTPAPASASAAEAPEAAPDSARPAAAAPGPARPAEPPRPAAARQQPRLAMPWSAISIAAALGALLGTGLTYALVNILPLPGARPPFADPTPRLEAQQSALAALEARLAATAVEASRAATGLDTLVTLRTALEQLRADVAALPPPAAAIDLAPITAQLATLEDRLAAIGAGASSGEAEALATSLTGIEQELATLGSRIAALDARTAAAETALTGLAAELAAAEAAIAARDVAPGPAELGPAVRLPLVLSSLESAFANGRAYGAELASLATLVPGLAVPAPLASAAAEGLPRPDAVAQRLAAAVPEILAGRSATGSGDLAADALEWMKGILALRPLDESEGDAPEAIVSRLEAAVGRRDFAAAAALFAALPAPMQAAAGAVGNELAALAAADGFVTALRARALAPATEAAP